MTGLIVWHAEEPAEEAAAAAPAAAAAAQPAAPEPPAPSAAKKGGANKRSRRTHRGACSELKPLALACRRFACHTCFQGVHMVICSAVMGILAHNEHTANTHLVALCCSPGLQLNSMLRMCRRRRQPAQQPASSRHLLAAGRRRRAGGHGWLLGLPGLHVRQRAGGCRLRDVRDGARALRSALPGPASATAVAAVATAACEMRETGRAPEDSGAAAALPQSCRWRLWCCSSHARVPGAAEVQLWRCSRVTATTVQ